MALPKFGLNVSNLQNIKAPNITLPTTGEEAISLIPQKANELAGAGVLAHGILGGLGILLYWILSDKLPLGEFKYSDIRAMFLSTAITSVMGVVMLEINYLQSFKSLAFYIILGIVFYIFLMMMENRQ